MRRHDDQTEVRTGRHVLTRTDVHRGTHAFHIPNNRIRNVAIQPDVVHVTTVRLECFTESCDEVRPANSATVHRPEHVHCNYLTERKILRLVGAPHGLGRKFGVDQEPPIQTVSRRKLLRNVIPVHPLGTMLIQQLILPARVEHRRSAATSASKTVAPRQLRGLALLASSRRCPSRGLRAQRVSAASTGRQTVQRLRPLPPPGTSSSGASPSIIHGSRLAQRQRSQYVPPPLQLRADAQRRENRRASRTHAHRRPGRRPSGACREATPPGALCNLLGKRQRALATGYPVHRRTAGAQ